MNLRVVNVCTVLLLMTSVPLMANRKLAEHYISMFKDIAVEEMHRTGIPASIKLAQGLLESSWGQSDLAVRANNHFGIKCGGDWNGLRYFKMDDDKDSMGNAVESCFRQFSSARESYIAHSEFLTNPAKSARYGFLFKYPTTDYVSWAEGLQFSGYATDKRYADKIIQLIETYRLHQYDVPVNKGQNDIPVLAGVSEKMGSVSPADVPVLVNADVVTATENNEAVTKRKLKKKINGVTCVVAEEGETIETIAKKYKANKHDIVIFNESRFYLDTPLKDGQIIFLESKKRFNNDVEYHVVKEAESLFDIAQKYGIRSSSLASRNKIPEHARLAKGLQLFINQPGMDHSYLREEIVTEEFIDFGTLK
jgi:LysM repeat protein